MGLCAFLLVCNVRAEATYEELLEIFPQHVLDSLPEETYNKYTTLDMDSVQKYEYTESFGDNFVDISPFASTVTTNYKRVTITVASYGDGLNYLVSLDNLWSLIPSVHSYDVIALRFTNFEMDYGSQYGFQYYKTSSGGATQSVYYSYGGTNMVLEDDGFGISMNIVNGDLYYLENFIAVDVAKSSTTGTAYGSYQHAIEEVTLAESQSYTLSGYGLGDVINFSTDVRGCYDGMPGVSLTR